MASLVCTPSCPSAGPGLNPASFKRSCACRTSPGCRSVWPRRSSCPIRVPEPLPPAPGPLPVPGVDGIICPFASKGIASMADSPKTNKVRFIIRDLWPETLTVRGSAKPSKDGVVPIMSTDDRLTSVPTQLGTPLPMEGLCRWSVLTAFDSHFTFVTQCSGKNSARVSLLLLDAFPCPIAPAGCEFPSPASPATSHTRRGANTDLALEMSRHPTHAFRFEKSGGRTWRRHGKTQHRRSYVILIASCDSATSLSFTP